WPEAGARRRTRLSGRWSRWQLQGRRYPTTSLPRLANFARCVRAPLGCSRPLVEGVLRARRLDEPVAQRERDSLELRVHAQLAHDVLDVGPERVRGDEEPLADL